MVSLSETESTNRWLQHQTWTRIGETHFRRSPLQNQFALAEYELPPPEATSRFRRWLWQEMQDEYNVVWRELSQLATARERGQDVEVRVPKGASHGEVIVRAVEWMVEHTRARVLPDRCGHPSSSGGWDVTDGVLSTPAELDADQVVWVTGQTQSRLGVVQDGSRVVVPEYGDVPLKNVHRADPRLASHPHLQERLNQALDEAFAQEAATTSVDYGPDTAASADRFDMSGDWFWAPQDDETLWHYAAASRVLDEPSAETEEVLSEAGPDGRETVSTIAFDTTWREPQRIPRLPVAMYKAIRPVYRHCGDNSPLMICSPTDQLAGRAFRYANKEDAASYRQTFRPQLHTFDQVTASPLSDAGSARTE